jgi:hypothetical protein
MPRTVVAESEVLMPVILKPAIRDIQSQMHLPSIPITYLDNIQLNVTFQSFSIFQDVSRPEFCTDSMFNKTHPILTS